MLGNILFFDNFSFLNSYSFFLKKQNLLLLPQKAIYWVNQEMLIVTDIHLGKVGHFRKAGIPIPRNMEQEDLASLSDLIRTYNPKSFLILGDFFHSILNQDWHWVTLWRDQFPNLEIILVKGNHDIIPSHYFEELGIKVYEEMFLVDPFLFTHQIIPSALKNETLLYSIGGHIHPAIILRGKGHQNRTLACFYFTQDYGILPAFGRFTGTFKVSSTKNAKIFIVGGGTVFAFPSNEPN